MFLRQKEGHRRRTAGGVYMQLIRKDETILNCQRKKIFIEDSIKKKHQKAAKRLVQKKKFNKCKKELQDRVAESKQIQNSNEENDGDGFDDMEEGQMIYFDE